MAALVSPRKRCRLLMGICRCVPKMDHHCPWTINCVSHRTFPHFLRFLFYATASMMYLEYFIYLRVAVVWAGRNLPSVCRHRWLIRVHCLLISSSISALLTRSWSSCSSSLLSIQSLCSLLLSSWFIISGAWVAM